MKDLNLVTKIIVCTYDELNQDEKKLIDCAKVISQTAFAPYSNFQVGAAVRLANQEIICGNNQENISFSATLCAERTTLAYANARFPDQAVESMAIAARSQSNFTEAPISPCGICRQVLLETEKRFRKNVNLLLYGEKEIFKINCIRDILPLAFDTL